MQPLLQACRHFAFATLLLLVLPLHAQEQTGTYWLIGPSAVERGADIATAGLKN